MWTREFESQAYGGYAHRYEGLHLIDADEFIFYRFVNFNEGMYGKTVSELHAGNLRTPGSDSRYAKLFPNHRLSYWSGSYQTAMEETLKHGGTQDRLIFKAYDDGSSTFQLGHISHLKSLMVETRVSMTVDTWVSVISFVNLKRRKSCLTPMRF